MSYTARLPKAERAAEVAALLAMPEGTAGTLAYTLLGRNGSKAEYSRFAMRIRGAIRRGEFPEGRIVFERKQAGPEARRQRIREIVTEAGTISVRGIGYKLLGEGVIANMKYD